MFYLQFLTLLRFLLYTTHYSKLHYSTLHHTTIPHYASLYYIIRFYSTLSSTIIYYTIIYYTVLYYTILYYTILYCTKLYYNILYHIILYDSMLREVNYIILYVLSCPVLSNTTAHCSQIFCYPHSKTFHLLAVDCFFSFLIFHRSFNV